MHVHIHIQKHLYMSIIVPNLEARVLVELKLEGRVNHTTVLPLINVLILDSSEGIGCENVIIWKGYTYY